MPIHNFLRAMERSSRRRRSNIILALDPIVDDPKTLLSKSLEIVEDVSTHVCALKINRHLVLPLGLNRGVREILRFAELLDLPTIMDCKINDVGHTNHEIARHYFKAGFGAVTANPFVGWKGGLRPVFELAKDLGRGVILLVYMSHQGADEGYGQQVIDAETGRSRSQYRVFAEKSLRWGADGVVVGATYLKKMKEIRKILGKTVPIYSPGIGAQGGTIEGALRAGARYLIVGRSIFLAKDPGGSAKKLQEIALSIGYS